ncbi:MAG: exosortase E/protease, VPEID-CTERM system [Terriglobia bacterium]
MLLVEGLLAHLRVQREYHALTSDLAAGLGSFSIARWSLAFAVFSAVIAFRGIRNRFREISRERQITPVSSRFAILHFCALGMFLNAGLPPVSDWMRGAGWPMPLAVWLCSGASAIVFAGMALVPFRTWVTLLRGTGKLWLCGAALAGIVTELSQRIWTEWDQSRWNFATDATFWLVKQLLRPFLHNVTLNSEAHIIGSEVFQIRIAGVCSGWEGVGLAMVFSIVWLWLERRESRFPQALVLIPGAMISIFLLNAVRLAILIMIGDHGYPGVAMSGFHSQAGWIAFNGLVLGITLVAPRIAWIRVPEGTAPSTAGLAVRNDEGRNPAVAFLLPFAVILAAGTISRATTDGFEWLYPLRFAAAAAVLWLYRRDYPIQLEKPGWFAMAAGVVVFAMWIALDHGPSTDNGISSGLAALPAPARIGWIVFRVLAATTTVPLAEELAFRGFLARRIMSANFESIDLRRLSWLAVACSSLVFGLMHGDRWLAGAVAGVVYAAVIMRRGKILDSVVAHAVTNMLLAVWVLSGGRWYFW